MKKVILVVLAVMLASVFLTAAAPPLKLLRLTVINKSGNEVYLKLEGSELGGQFYYLTIAAGTKEYPKVEVFTVLSDIYSRTTWYGPGDYAECEGVKSSGQLIMDRNNRLVFTPCYTIPTRQVDEFECVEFDKWDFCKRFGWVRYTVENHGEPSMEKVVYFKWLEVYQGHYYNDSSDSWLNELIGCGYDQWYRWKVLTDKTPTGCKWRYQY